MRFPKVVAFTVTTLGCALNASAQDQAPVPIRVLSSPQATTTKAVRAMFGDVRETPRGGLIVNDAIAHQILRFERDLSALELVRDSVSGLNNYYGPRAAFLIPYVGDSALLLDVASQTLQVMTPDGAFGRIMALPNNKDLGLVVAPGTSTDARGRLIYLGNPRSQPSAPGSNDKTPGDSAPLLRADFEQRRVDTVAMIKIATDDRRVTTGEGNTKRVETIVNPMQNVDGWSVLRDGTIVIIRGFDYHAEWIDSNDRKSAGAKLPFAWRKITDDEKLKLIDSVKAYRHKRDSINAANAIAAGRPAQEKIVILDGHDQRVADPTKYVTSFVPLAKMPDYYPPLRPDALHADRDGNLWILPTTTDVSLHGELVYDIMNRAGQLLERVRVPEGRSLAGFGPSGVVYLKFRATDGWHIERTTVVR